MSDISGEAVTKLKETSLKQLVIKDYFNQCIKNNFGCAIYRLPKKSTKHLIIDLSGGEKLNHIHLDEMSEGFIFHPFSTDHHEIKFINKDLHFIEQEEAQNPEIIHSKISHDEINEIFKHQINSSEYKSANIHKNNKAQKNDLEEKLFKRLVEKAIAEIDTGEFQKVVISRAKEIDLTDQFEVFNFFTQLCDRYKNAFVYLTYIPGIGIWIGATPEILIEIDKNNNFKTVALAATQAFSPALDVAETTWSQKDIEEQAMVSRFIINCFKKIRLREFEEIGPRTHLSGNLVHLKTDYNVDMDQVSYPQLGSVMLELLHPTSAVCGMPKEPAKDFINENEGFDREYFSGFLGPVNMEDETNIFVNLRCMKLVKQKAKLYAGAGIISYSNPQKEWNETEIKMQTLLKVLREMY